MTRSSHRPTERGEKMRRWAERLREEYDHACFTHRVRLRRPVILVTDLGSRWGTWDPSARTLTLSAHLVEKYAWSAVVEVLKHEMAHQLVDEEWGGDEGHGPLFHRACDALGVAAWAKRAVVEVGEDLRPGPERGAEGEEDAPEGRMLRRVEKLLALANSSNEHEAVAAMKKVRELYGRYNIERLTEKREEALESIYLRLGDRRVERFQYLLCSLLSDHFFVEVVHTELYDAEQCAPYKAAELLGTKQNVLMAEFVYGFLVQQTVSLWERYRAEPAGEKTTRRRRRASRGSYLAGVIAGFREKLELPETVAASEAPAPAVGGPPPVPSTALVVPPDPALENYLAYRYPRLVRLRSGGRLGDRSSYERGKSEGRSIVLHKPVGGRGGFGGLLR